MFGRRRKRAQEVDEATRHSVEQQLRQMGIVGPGDGPIRLERVGAAGPVAPAAAPAAEALRLRVRSDLPDQLVHGMVSRPLAQGVWEIVAVDQPTSMMLLPRPADRDEAALFRDAVTNTVEEPFTLDRIDEAPIPLLHIGGTHEYMAAHVHVLSRYLAGPFADGALVAFPVPQVVLVHQIADRHPFVAAGVLQQLAEAVVADGEKPISGQVFWWRPSPRELAAPGRDVETGHRPDLRPVTVQVGSGGAMSVHGDADFRQLAERLSHLQ